jgi:hypothetical protein
MNEDGSLVQFWAPVPPNLWLYFANVPECALVRENLKGDDVDEQPDIIDGLGVALFIPVKYLSETERMWLTYGETLKPDGAKRVYEEWVGGLADRRVNPLPGEGGDVLVAHEITPEWVELEWASSANAQAVGIANPARTRSIPPDHALRQRRAAK